MTKTNRIQLESPCPHTCQLLREQTSPAQSDPPIPLAHFECTWRTATKLANWLIFHTLETYPLKMVTAAAESGARHIRRADPSAARYSMACDAALKADLEQDVALALWWSIKNGRIRAARPVLNQWLRTTVPRLVRHRARPAALLKLVSPPTEDECEAAAGVSLPVEVGLTIEDRDEALPREVFALLLGSRPEARSTLPPGEHAAFELWLAGLEPSEIAVQLGIRGGAVRARLSRARNRVLDAVRSSPPNLAA